MYKEEQAKKLAHADVELDLQTILAGVARVIGSDKDADIAAALGVGRSTPATWRRRDYLPLSEVAVFAISQGIPIEEILLGKRSEKQEELLYQSKSDTVSNVIQAQSDLGLAFTAVQLDLAMEYAYKTQSDVVGIKEFIETAYKFAGRDTSPSK